jgi:hypothetical protein
MAARVEASKTAGALPPHFDRLVAKLGITAKEMAALRFILHKQAGFIHVTQQLCAASQHLVTRGNHGRGMCTYIASAVLNSSVNTIAVSHTDHAGGLGRACIAQVWRRPQLLTCHILRHGVCASSCVWPITMLW